jgi:hypothetical protein
VSGSHYMKNKIRMDANHKSYVDRNKEKVKLYNKQWWKEHPDKKKVYNKKHAEKARDYYKKNKERMNRQSKAYTKANPDKVRDYNRKWRNTDKGRRTMKVCRRRKWRAILASRIIYYLKICSDFVVPKICEKCNCENILQAHHEDYKKPLEVVWLCKECHKLRHAEINQQGIDLHASL